MLISWVAICRGAVIHGITSLGLSECLDVKVETRIARMSYGVMISLPFNPKLHSPEDRYIDACTLEPMATKQMEWLLRKVWTAIRITPF